VSAPLTVSQVAARLDRLPVSRFHYRFLARLSLGVWFDIYDNFIAGALALALPAAGVLANPKPGEAFSELGVFMAALPLGMFLGTIFLGMACDILGRRLAFIAMLLLYSLATLAGGLGYYPLVAVAGSTAGLVLLVATRFLAGAGVGAENVVMDTYISEMMPRHSRGWSGALSHAAIFTAVPAAALLARWLAPVDRPEGWRWLLVIGSLGALFAWYFRRSLPESPRWSASVGRTDEARQTLEAIEGEVERETGPLPPPEEVPTTPAKRRHAFREIWSPRYRGRTLMLIGFQLLQTIGYYGFMHWVPRLLEAKGYKYNQALEMQFYAYFLAPLGPMLAFWYAERGQRKWILVGLALGLASLQTAFSLTDSTLLLIGLGALIVIGCNWFSAVFHAYQAELFPTEARATGVGFTYAWSRASMVVIALFMPGLIAADYRQALALTASGFVGVALVLGLFGPLTNRRALEEVSPAGGD
jgi:putative MFS transporter